MGSFLFISRTDLKTNRRNADEETRLFESGNDPSVNLSPYLGGGLGTV